MQSCKQCASLLGHAPDKEQILASLVYDDFVKSLILKFKNGKSIQFAELFAKLFHKEDFFDVDFVIPVPIHMKKLYKRTYNQTALLAFALKRLYYWFPSILFNTLKKVRYTESQKGKNFRERRENVANSFLITKKGESKIKGKVVAVLDDVVASGATLLECKKMLEQVGAKEVRCIALAKSFGQ
jgi:ComF family protein